MKKIFTMIAFAISMSAMAQTNKTLDTSELTAFYDYTIRTQDDNGEDVTDSLQLALQVGTRATNCTAAWMYNNDDSGDERRYTYMMHHQNVLTDVENKEVICVETIYPNNYETHEPMAEIKWVLTNDTMTIASLLCHRATGELYGKRWTAWYAEDIPTSAGPWKLRGLPGLIVKAEDAEGIHCFSLYETKNEAREIDYAEHPDYQKVSRKQLMAFKKKVLGNARYPKDPTHYVAQGFEPMLAIRTSASKETLSFTGMTTHMMILAKSHVYQPLELK